jgi:hypothetical protein
MLNYAFYVLKYRSSNIFQFERDLQVLRNITLVSISVLILLNLM